jgi:hypothetical protein
MVRRMTRPSLLGVRLRLALRSPFSMVFREEGSQGWMMRMLVPETETPAM